MKRMEILLLSFALLLALLCGCGANPAPGTAAGGAETQTAADAGYGAADAMEPAEPADGKVTDGRLQKAKLIYTADMEMETTAFDQADRDVGTLVEQMGGYFEHSSINNYGSGYRSGSYTVRVPAEQFKPFCEQVGKLCHITYKSTDAENISEAYYDTESRLTTQTTKLERLQSLLAKASKMEDIITIESAISETELAIEKLSGTLRQYDALVDYSTVCLTLSEVYKLSNTEEPASGFPQRLGAAFSSGWKGFTAGVEHLMVALAYAWPWLLVLAIAVVAGIRVVTARRKKMLLPKRPPISGGDEKS